MTATSIYDGLSILQYHNINNDADILNDEELVTCDRPIVRYLATMKIHKEFIKVTNLIRT